MAPKRRRNRFELVEKSKKPAQDDSDPKDDTVRVRVNEYKGHRDSRLQHLSTFERVDKPAELILPEECHPQHIVQPAPIIPKTQTADDADDEMPALMDLDDDNFGHRDENEASTNPDGTRSRGTVAVSFVLSS